MAPLSSEEDELLTQSPQEKQANIASRVRVLTLNTLCSPVPNNYETAGRLQGLVEHIKSEGYDIVCLQEFQQRTCVLGIMDGAHVTAHEEFCKAMHDLGYCDQVIGPPERGDAVFDGGTAIFSKHGFTIVEMIPWVEQSCWDAWAAKGVVYARIDVPSPRPQNGAAWPHTVPLHVMTLHAQAKHVGWMDLNGIEEYRRVRLRQMEQLAEVIATRAGRDAVLALGDFNFNAQEAPELALHQQILKSCKHPRPPIDVLLQSYGHYPATFAEVDAAGQPVESFLTMPENRGTPKCLDHVYFWPSAPGSAPHCSLNGSITSVHCSVEPMRVPQLAYSPGSFTHLSDHYGLSVDLNVSWPWAVSPSGCGARCSCVHIPKPRLFSQLCSAADEEASAEAELEVSLHMLSGGDDVLAMW